MPKMPTIDRFTPDQLELVSTCPWCRSNRCQALFEENGFPYVQCSLCSLIFLARRVKEEFVHLIYDQPAYHPAGNAAYTLRNGEKRLALLGPLAPGSRIFEDGAGAGGFLAACQRRGFYADGGDLGADSIQRTRESFGIELRHGTLEAQALPSASCDVFASFNLLSHVYRPWAYLKEVHRILVPNGILYLRTGDRTGYMKKVNWGSWSAPEHVYHYTRSVLEEMLCDAGFQTKRWIPAFDSDFPYLFFRRRERLAGIPRRLAQLACSYSTFAWTKLGLPKDDVFIIATSSTAPSDERTSTFFSSEEKADDQALAARERSRAEDRA